MLRSRDRTMLAASSALDLCQNERLSVGGVGGSTGVIVLVSSRFKLSCRSRVALLHLY